MAEVIPVVVLFACLFFGGDWIGEVSDELEAERALHGHALAIAMGQANTAMTTEYERLQPTLDFVRAETGPVVVDGLVYDVELRITDLDGLGHLRRIDVRVAYERGEGERALVETRTVRQAPMTSHARTGSPSKRTQVRRSDAAFPS